MAVKYNTQSPRGTPMIGFVQDSILSMHILSEPGLCFTVPQAMQLLVQSPYWSEKQTQIQNGSGFVIQPTFWVNKVPYVTGIDVLSHLLPTDLFIHLNAPAIVKNESTTLSYMDRKELRICGGRLMYGQLDKPKLNRVLQVIFKDYGPDTLLDFLHSAQLVGNWALLTQSPTVGIADCQLPKLSEQVKTECLSRLETFLQENESQMTEDNIILLLNMFQDKMTTDIVDRLKHHNINSKTQKNGKKIRQLCSHQRAFFSQFRGYYDC
jgi:hypothetical protein